MIRSWDERGEDFDLVLPAFDLEAGGRVDPHVVRGWSWGRSDAPVVLLIHALTGDARADSWWGPMIGAERVLDPARWRLLCFNLLGSCYGSSGPGTEGYPGGTQLTTWDQARSLLLALDALGIEEVHLCVGGSLGGMVALCLAALAPERIERLAPIAAAASASAWVVGFNHVAREIVRLDPGFPEDAGRGLSVARQLAMLTYRAERGLDERQPRSRSAPWASEPAYPIRGYLEHQGEKLVRRFDGRAYLCLLDAMDHHDLSRRPADSHDGAARQAAASLPRGEGGVAVGMGDESWGLSRIRSSVLAVSVDSDQLFFPSQTTAFAKALRRRGRFVEEATIQSVHGHDAFLIEWEQLAGILARALSLPTETK